MFYGCYYSDLTKPFSVLLTRLVACTMPYVKPNFFQHKKKYIGGDNVFKEGREI